MSDNTAGPKHNPWEIYQNVCSERFKTIEDKVDDLHATVKNGLTDKVKALEKMNWFIITGIIGVLALAVFDLLVRH